MEGHDNSPKLPVHGRTLAGMFGRSPPRAYLAIAIGVPLLHILVRASPLGPNLIYVMLGVPFLMLVWLGAALWGLSLVVRYMRQRSFLPALLSAVLPLGIFLAAVTFPRFLYACNTAGDLLHFVVARPYYERAVARLPTDSGSRLAVFNWGGMSWASGGLVYDESDQIALPAGMQSAAWMAKAKNTELSCGYRMTPLWSHYYLADFQC